MRASDILLEKGRGVVTIGPDRTVHDAICTMNDHKIGALIVTGKDGGVVGIITERDVLQMCGEQCVQLEKPAQDAAGCPALVQDVMTRDVVVGVPGDQLDYLMGVMTKNRVRHLPIMDVGQLVGIVSIGDVVRAHLGEAVYENRQLRDYIHGLPAH